MGDLSERLALLSAERRRVLERLLQSKAAAPVSGRRGKTGATPVRHQPADEVSRFYESVNRQLDSAEYGQFVRFLNYGYVSDGGGDRAVVELPPYALNRPSVKLVLELVGDCGLHDRSVLDVGCGRGGLLDTLATYFQPRRLTGVDLCARAVCFAGTVSPRTAATFLAADAQRLPFADRSFDVVTNLESSHTYPCVEDFYREVFRVLRPRGAFLYGDALSKREVRPSLAMLRRLGFRVEVERDVTANVLLSCDAYAASRRDAFDGAPAGATLEDFLATPGSKVYRKLDERAYLYLLYRLRKPAARA